MCVSTEVFWFLLGFSLTGFNSIRTRRQVHICTVLLIILFVFSCASNRLERSSSNIFTISSVFKMCICAVALWCVWSEVVSAGCGQVLLYYGENRLDHPIDYRLYSLSNQETRNHFTYNFIIYYGDNPACIDIVTHSQRAIWHKGFSVCWYDLFLTWSNYSSGHRDPRWAVFWLHASLIIKMETLKKKPLVTGSDYAIKYKFEKSSRF